MCKAEVESPYDLSVRCPFARALWDLALSYVRVFGAVSNSISNHVSPWESFSGGKARNKNAILFPHAIFFWNIWNGRSRRVFGYVELNASKLIS